MEVTEVKIQLRDREDGRLKAYATVTFDNAFVVRDMKIIDGRKGLFVAMPSRKRRVPCSHCGYRNVVGSRYCNRCGANIEKIARSPENLDNRTQHRDIAHPITTEAREYIQGKVIEAYKEEKERRGGGEVEKPQEPSEERPKEENL